MGYGDEIMASYYAKGARERGKRIAFGNGRQIIFSKQSHEVFWNNPNIAFPGSEQDRDIEWVTHSYRGVRLYNTHDHVRNKWTWNKGFGDRPGEIYLTKAEKAWAEAQGSGYVVIEPNVPAFKAVGPNKQWPEERFAEVAHRITKQGLEVVQFYYPPPYGPGIRLQNVRQIKPPDFRHGVAALRKASLFVGPEGGLHHAAAALGQKAVVIFGGFISPEITGYSSHSNIYIGGEPCGTWEPCRHCAEALRAISVQTVFDAAMGELNGKSVS